jgi:KDO2-lipid IV(A) lauroyltransferase
MRHLILPVIKLLGLFLHRMPAWFGRLCGDLFGLLWFDVIRLRRRLVLDNIAIAFPDWDRKRRLRVGRRSMRNLGRAFMDLLILPWIDQAWMRQNVMFHGMENFERANKGGQGMLFLSLHIGSGDLAISMLSLAGMDVHVISKKFTAKLANDLWFDLRQRHGTRYIDHRDSTAEIFKALRKNGVVVFVMDQFAPSSIGIRATFFGKEAGTGIGLALFASKKQLPVLPVYAYRDDNGIHHIVVGEEIPLEMKDTRQETLSHMTEQYNRTLEEIIRRHPDQWMWLHRRWKPFF